MVILTIMRIKSTFNLEKDLLRANLNKYTRKAFHMLPRIDKPRILDIGCGSGVPTLELARLSKGQIIGLDIDQHLLDILSSKARDAGLSGRVRTMNCSIFDMDFPDESFDILWSEGAISSIGFERGLREWRRFLKTHGFLVIHDEMGNLEGKIAKITASGYDLLRYFIISEDIWWTSYFQPLQKRINNIRLKYIANHVKLSALNEAQREIDMLKKNPECSRSVFFVMKKS